MVKKGKFPICPEKYGTCSYQWMCLNQNSVGLGYERRKVFCLSEPPLLCQAKRVKKV